MSDRIPVCSFCGCQIIGDSMSVKSLDASAIICEQCINELSECMVAGREVINELKEEEEAKKERVKSGNVVSLLKTKPQADGRGPFTPDVPIVEEEIICDDCGEVIKPDEIITVIGKGEYAICESCVEGWYNNLARVRADKLALETNEKREQAREKKKQNNNENNVVVAFKRPE